MTNFLDVEEPDQRKMETIVSMEELASKPPPDEPEHNCCGCCCGRMKKTTRNPQLPPAQMQYKCVRKCAAVTCSLLGLLFAIVVYLSIGSVLFRYLERDAQQARLAHGLWMLNEVIENYNLGGKSVSKRADSLSSLQVEANLASYCLDQQFEAVIGELKRLKAKKENVDSRVTEVMDTEELEQLANAIQMSYAEQMETFALLLSEQNQAERGGRRNMPIVSGDSVLTQVYEAILAGWRPEGSQRIKLPVTSRGELPKPMSLLRLGAKPRSNQRSSDLLPPFNKPSTKTDPWTYSGALFYAVTVITTIGEWFILKKTPSYIIVVLVMLCSHKRSSCVILGYGHIVPTTQLGKICTIIYGFFGIPLMLLFLANLGSLMADTFRLGYRHICYCSRKKKDLAPVQRPLPKNAPARALQMENVRHCSTGQVESESRPGRKPSSLATVAPRAGSSSPALRDRPGRIHKTPPT
ncbi:unnamed protein product, partial [Dibothriocephalus latus]